MGQDIELERQLDQHPVHEIHAKDLPDYHYWPSIQNDRNPKAAVLTPNRIKYHRDQTDFPRFFKNGTPKTPPQEQIFALDLTEDGRFDWKKNIEVNSVAPMFSEKGWNNRFLRRAWKPMFATRMGVRMNSLHHPIYFKHREMPRCTRFFRMWKGSFLAHPLMFGSFWFMIVGTVFSGAGTYGETSNKNEPWNPDVHYVKEARRQGGFHGFI